MSLKGRKILIGMTGGIACYKIPYLVRLLRKAGTDVRIVMTESATRFITPLTLETVSDNPVAVQMFPQHQYVSIQHIDLAVWPDLFLVAPATANFLGKAASGISDDLLTTVFCAVTKPVMIAPAMNPGMWGNQITQKNVACLREFGYRFIEPTEGDMACDEQGVGRLPEPEQLFEAVSAFFRKGAKKKLLTGRHVLVSAGPCREPVDPVRFLSNRSSGKMGYALARAALEIGAYTTLVSGPTGLIPPPGVTYVSVETTRQMYDAIKRRFGRTDILIMAAAPSDYRPVSVAAQKIKKQSTSWQLRLEPTTDILKTLSTRKKTGQVLVGFALETEAGEVNARKKLKDKKLDLIVLNSLRDESAAFDSDTNKVTLLAPGGRAERWPLMYKDEIAVKLLEKIARML